MSTLLRNKSLWTLTLGHLSIDLYAGAMPIVMVYFTNPRLPAPFHLSVAEAGLVFSLYFLSSSISQPLFGYLSDRFGGRGFAAGGLVWMAVLQGLVGFLPDYTTLLIALPLAGFGSAAFHPQSASRANRVAGDQKTTGMAIFLLGGNAGFALGPLVATTVLGLLGLGGTAFLGLIGLLIAPFLYAAADQAPKPTTQAEPSRPLRRLKRNVAFSAGAVLALMIVMSLRAWLQSAVSSYLPLYFTSLADFTVDRAGQLSFVILISLALGSLAGGFVADRVGGRVIMVIAYLISAPATFALLWTRDERAFLFAPIVGLMAGAAWPPAIVMAQELFPRHAAVASGLALGFVFAMGGLGTGLTGFLAEPERLGLLNSMLVLSLLPLVAAIFTLGLPSHSAVMQASREAQDELEMSRPAVREATGG